MQGFSEVLGSGTGVHLPAFT